MGDNRVLYNYVAEEEVKYAVNEDQEDWSWMQNTCAEDDTTNAAEVGENYYDDDGINYEVENSYSCESSQQVAREGGTTSGYGHRRVRPATGGHTSFLLEDDQTGSLQSSERDEYPKVRPVKLKTKKKGVSRQFEHLQEPSLDAHSDPGYGDDHSYETPDVSRSQSINLVSSWLQDASLGEHLKDESGTAQYGRAPPARRPPPRRHPPGADIVGRSSSLPNHYGMGHYDHYEAYPADAQYNDKTPPYDPASGYYPEAHYEENQLAIYDPSVSSAPGSTYRLEQKPLDKAFKLMKNGATGIANVSKNGAVVFANASKTAAFGLRNKSIELKKMAIPVMKPILDAVLEESKEQLMGLDRERGRAYPLQRPNIAQLERMATPYVPALGRGPAGPMPRPMQRPPMMRPGVPPGQRPVMRPVIMAGMRPGMPPQGAVPPMVVSAARGQGVTMRGQPRPRGRARSAVPIDHQLM